MKDRESLFFNNVGSNDKYLITKLRSYNITVEKIEAYLTKLQTDSPQDDNNKMALSTLVQFLQMSNQSNQSDLSNSSNL